MSLASFGRVESTIEKVAGWMASDPQVCLFADDTSVSMVSSLSPPSRSGEQEKKVLINRLKDQAMARLRSLHSASQENNHNESKKQRSSHNKHSKRSSRASDTFSSDQSSESNSESTNQNYSNRHGERNRQRRQTEQQQQQHQQHQQQQRRSTRHQRPSSSQPQRREAGDDPKDDAYLERIVERATQEIRKAIYKLKEEKRLPDSCHLKMKLSIKPQKPGRDREVGSGEDNNDEKGRSRVGEGNRRDSKDDGRRRHRRESKEERRRPERRRERN